MAKGKNFTFEKLNTETENTGVIPSVVQTILTETGPSTKVTFDCPNELVEKMKDYGYWEGMSQKEIIIESLNVFFEGKKLNERPEKVKNRKKVGRKPNAIKAYMN